jgi:hypothetical protein
MRDEAPRFHLEFEVDGDNIICKRYKPRSKAYVDSITYERNGQHPFLPALSKDNREKWDRAMILAGWYQPK